VTVVLRVVTGQRAGHVITSEGATVLIGRDPAAELRFDPEGEREVSARHATVYANQGRWWVKDLGSRNGTFVNGNRIIAPTELRNGDRIGVGGTGTEVGFTIVDVHEHTPLGDTIPVTRSAHPTPTARIRAEVQRRTRHWKWVVLGVVVGASAVIGLLVVRNHRLQTRWALEREHLRARADSAIRTSDRLIVSLQGDVAELAGALRVSQGEIRSTGAALDRATTARDAREVAVLRDRLTGALSLLGAQEAAARLDRERIRSLNARAIARVFAESPSGEVTTGTAFAVRRDATLITTDHILAANVKRLAVQFSYSDQVWPARVVMRDSVHDLAVLKVDAILGDVPVVHGFNLRPDTLPAGAPVLMIGYPLGGDMRPSARPGKSMISPILGAASAIGIANGQIEVRGYGTNGSSGSPIFDANGEIVGVVFGGQAGASAASVFGILSDAVARVVNYAPKF
jgi:S1-C subfamily serine protease